MKWILCMTWLLSAFLSLNAEEDSTSPPLGYNSGQQGGSRLYPSLSGATDYNNRNDYNYGPGQTGNNYNTGSRYPYQQTGGNQPYPVGTGPYNMTYSGYPSSINHNGYNSSFNNNNRPGQNNYGAGSHIGNPHQPFGQPKPIVNPHQPFGTPGGTVNNPYNNIRNLTIPYNPTNSNSRQPAYPNNLSYPTYPTNPTYPNNPSYPRNPSNPGNGNPWNYPNYPTNPGNSGYRNDGTNYPRQPARNNDPHRPFGQPSTSGVAQPKYNPYYKQ